jgi:hypothetical protein
MGRKAGKQTYSKGDAQAKVLALLEQGATVTAAMAAVDRQDTAFRQWTMADADFKEASDKARLAGKGIKADLANMKELPFHEFSEQFLDSRLFNHQLNWIDLIEGKEPVGYLLV